MERWRSQGPTRPRTIQEQARRRSAAGESGQERRNYCKQKSKHGGSKRSQSTPLSGQESATALDTKWTAHVWPSTASQQASKQKQAAANSVPRLRSPSAIAILPKRAMQSTDSCLPCGKRRTSLCDRPVKWSRALGSSGLAWCQCRLPCSVDPNYSGAGGGCFLFATSLMAFPPTNIPGSSLATRLNCDGGGTGDGDVSGDLLMHGEMHGEIRNFGRVFER